jgi:uncharacterized protein with PQ loop repeat
MVIGLFLWLAYGFMAGSQPIIWANFVTIVIAGYILVMKIKLDILKQGAKPVQLEGADSSSSL